MEKTVTKNELGVSKKYLAATIGNLGLATLAAVAITNQPAIVDMYFCENNDTCKDPAQQPTTVFNSPYSFSYDQQQGIVVGSSIIICGVYGKPSATFIKGPKSDVALPSILKIKGHDSNQLPVVGWIPVSANSNVSGEQPVACNLGIMSRSYNLYLDGIEGNTDNLQPKGG